jgi:hypothetical protein
LEALFFVCRYAAAIRKPDRRTARPQATEPQRGRAPRQLGALEKRAAVCPAESGSDCQPRARAAGQEQSQRRKGQSQRRRQSQADCRAARPGQTDQIDNNRSAVYDKTGLSDAGIDAVNALESGEQPKNAADLITQGLAEQDRAGNVRLTTAGHAFLHAADKGDPAAAREALSHGSDKLAQAADKEKAKVERAGKQLAADVQRETAKRAKAKQSAGGGGSKKPEKPTEKPAQPAKERSTDKAEPPARSAEAGREPRQGRQRHGRER